MNISVFNGAGQVDYMYGLVSGLAQNKSDRIDVLDVDITSDIFKPFTNVVYHPVFRVPGKTTSVFSKGINVIRYYFLQIWFLVSHKSRIVHFQWLDRYKFIDRIILPTIARIFGHKVVLTVHNINSGKRDNRDTWGNRMSLRILYKLAHRLIVHTEQSKDELMLEFPTRESKVKVIKHGMNNRVAQSGLTTSKAREKFGIAEKEKVMLFFGNIDYYKGLDILIDSYSNLPEDFFKETRLLIAGNSKSADFTKAIKNKIDSLREKERVIAKFGYVPDEEVELYFMAADCIILPYRDIYQSGVIFMAYTFGLPIIVSDIGNFKNDMVEGKTGFLIPSTNPEQVTNALLNYYKSDVYLKLPESREKIKEWACQNYSWDVIGVETRKLYESIQ